MPIAANADAFTQDNCSGLTGPGFRDCTQNSLTWENYMMNHNNAQFKKYLKGMVKKNISGDSTAIDTYDLSVTKNGTGIGTITSSPDGISCGSNCTATYDSGTVVTLTETPVTGSTFTGWGGVCSGTASTCDVTMADNQSVIATFDSPNPVKNYSFSVTELNTGSGTVTSDAGGIKCTGNNGTCNTSVPDGTKITLTEDPASNSTFAGWGNSCSGTSKTCSVTINDNTNVTAAFNAVTPPPPATSYDLQVTNTGTGSGTVTDQTTPGQISCGSNCKGIYDTGSVVTLQATANTGSTFAGWGGACSGTGTCAVTMNSDENVTATFTAPTPVTFYNLNLTENGTGTGTITSVPVGINCNGSGAGCSATYNSGISVVLTAVPDAGTSNPIWTGCTASADNSTCTVSMTTNNAITANFNGVPTTTYNLTAATSGTGSGTVGVNPPGTSCGAHCATYNSGQSVVLSETPGTGSIFAGWGGGCSGSASTCNVSMNSDKAITATFNSIAPAPTVVSLSSFGDMGHGGNDTTIFQTALNAVAGKKLTLQVPLPAKSPYLVDPLTIKSDTAVEFVPGVVVQANEGYSCSSPILTIKDASNVTITGNGTTLQMPADERDTANCTLNGNAYVGHRHDLTIYGSNNVLITGLNFNNSGGDGIYINGDAAQSYSNNITIKDVTCNNNFRNGMSVISAQNLLVSNSHFTNSNGANPQSGIDLEPNVTTNRLVNINIENSTSSNNKNGVGFIVSPHNLNNTSQPISITFSNDTDTNSKYGFQAYGTAMLAKPVAGTVKVVNFTSNSSSLYGTTITDWSSTGANLTFSNLKIINSGQYGINISESSHSLVKNGNISFSSSVISNTIGKMQYYFNVTAPKINNLGYQNLHINHDQWNGAVNDPYGLYLGVKQKNVP
jgi:hypothetical protein